MGQGDNAGIKLGHLLFAAVIRRLVGNASVDGAAPIVIMTSTALLRWSSSEAAFQAAPRNPLRQGRVTLRSTDRPTQDLPKAMMSEEQTKDVPPDRLSIDPRSPFYSEEALSRDVGIRFNGVEKTNVHEYDVAEGWVRVEVPTAKDRRGNPMVIKLSGTVEPYFRPAE